MKWTHRRIYDFPDWRASTPRGGAPTYYLAKFRQKLHENEENWTERGACPKFYHTRCAIGTVIPEGKWKKLHPESRVDLIILFLQSASFCQINASKPWKLFHNIFIIGYIYIYVICPFWDTFMQMQFCSFISLLYLNCCNSIREQWRIQDFPEEGAPTPGGGAPTYDFAIFSQKLHEIERIWARRRAPLRSATGECRRLLP